MASGAGGVEEAARRLMRLVSDKAGRRAGTVTTLEYGADTQAAGLDITPQFYERVLEYLLQTGSLERADDPGHPVDGAASPGPFFRITQDGLDFAGRA
jgi:hypothetical protein